MANSLLMGTVYESRGSWYRVKIERGGEIKARIRGQLKLENNRLKKSNPVAVGDSVLLCKKKEDYIIQNVLECKNAFCRRVERGDREHVMAANIDQLCIVSSLRSPYVPNLFIDTLTIAASMFHIPVIIVFNKTDLYQEQDNVKYRKWAAMYSRIGYTIFPISSKEKTSCNLLEKALYNKRTLLVGYSGSGKSTIVNTLIPAACAATSTVNSAAGTGKHTTTFSKIYTSTDSRIEIIDTPGVRTFELPRIPADTLRLYMKDFLAYEKRCSFSNCAHIHESNCAIISGVEKGNISLGRYTTYVELYHYLKQIHIDNPSAL